MEHYWFNVGINLKIVCRVIYEVRCPAIAPVIILGLNRPLTSQSLAQMIERLICKLRFLPLRPKASRWYEQTNFIIDSSNEWRSSRQAGSVTQIFKLYVAAVQLCRRLNIKRLFVCIAASDNKPLPRSLLRSLHHSPSLCGRVPRSSVLVWQRSAMGTVCWRLTSSPVTLHPETIMASTEIKSQNWKGKNGQIQNAPQKWRSSLRRRLLNAFDSNGHSYRKRRKRGHKCFLLFAIIFLCDALDFHNQSHISSTGLMEPIRRNISEYSSPYWRTPLITGKTLFFSSQTAVAPECRDSASRGTRREPGNEAGRARSQWDIVISILQAPSCYNG